MSIYIKGMDMPTKCTVCPFVRDIGDYTFVGCKLNVGFAINRAFPYRHGHCPLVPVPPHGRLIDEQWLKDAMITTLEALKKNPKMDKQEMHLIAAFDTLRVMVEDASTIIPAEKGET